MADQIAEWDREFEALPPWRQFIGRWSVFLIPAWVGLIVLSVTTWNSGLLGTVARVGWAAFWGLLLTAPPIAFVLVYAIGWSAHLIWKRLF